MSLLRIENVSKSFGEGAARHRVLSQVSFHVNEGEFVMLVGRSGVGKTTLLNMLAGLLPADSGTLQLAGAEIRGPGLDRGVVFQHHGLLPWMSALSNVRLAVQSAFPKWTSAQKDEQARKALELVHLGAALGKMPHELSGGMRQRVAVARALAMEPRILLLDEPFGALDALTRRTLQEELERIRQSTGRTILMVSNDLDEAILLADRILPLDPDGQLGESLTVNLPHPRKLSEIVHSPEYRRLRSALVDALGARASRSVQSSTRVA